MFTAYTGSATLYLREKQSWYVDVVPTGNCQIFSILNAYCLFSAYTLDRKETRKEFCEAGRKAGMKRLCYIDVLESYAEKVKKVFDKDEIVFETPFVSTNGSKIHFFLINISKTYEE